MESCQKSENRGEEVKRITLSCCTFGSSNMLACLPPDVLENVLLFLGLLPELNQLCATSRQLYRLVHDYAMELYATPSVNLCNRCKNPTEGLPGSLPWTSISSPVRNPKERDKKHSFLSVSPQPMTQENMEKLLRDYVKATSIHLYHLQHMATCMFLPLNSDFRDRKRRGLPPRKLLSLGLHGCRVVSDEHTLDLGEQDVLKEIAVTGTILASYAGFTRSLVTGSKNLISVTLAGFRSLYDDNIEDLMKLLPKVQALCLSNDTQIVKPAINSATLQRLNLAGCCRFEGLKHPFICPNLRCLEVSQTVIRRNALCDIIAGAPLLEQLEARACQRIEELDVASTSLLYLDIRNCRYIKSTKLRCPNLETLAIGNCSDLQSLTIYSGQIKELNLSLLSRLSFLELDTPGLRQMGLAGCQVLSDIDGLAMCTNLEFVDICGTKLIERQFNCCFHYGAKLDIRRQQYASST